MNVKLPTVVKGSHRPAGKNLVTKGQRDRWGGSGEQWSPPAMRCKYVFIPIHVVIYKHTHCNISIPFVTYYP
jgi:hypothetical protein